MIFCVHSSIRVVNTGKSTGLFTLEQGQQSFMLHRALKLYSPAWLAGPTKAETAATKRERKKRTRAMVFY